MQPAGPGGSAALTRWQNTEAGREREDREAKKRERREPGRFIETEVTRFFKGLGEEKGREGPEAWC